MISALLVNEDSSVERIQLYHALGQAVPRALPHAVGGPGLAQLTLRPNDDRVGVAAWVATEHWPGTFNVTACIAAAVIVGARPLDTGDPWWPIYTSMLCGPVVFTGLAWKTGLIDALPEHVFDQIGAHLPTL